ncbi:MAG: hypothetical protein IH946_09425 [Bacteroidetes bacterium]|nr:hypothetical protein [Bacteroidota bacterium]
MIDNDSNQLFIFSDVMFYKDSIFNYYVYRSVHSGFKQIYGIFGSENPILKLTYTYFVSGQDQFGHAYSGYQRIHFFMKENGPIYRSRLKYISAAVNDKKSSFRHVKKARLFYWLSAVWGGIWIPSMVLAIPNLPVAATASVFFGIGISTAAFYSLGKGQQSKALSSY